MSRPSAGAAPAFAGWPLERGRAGDSAADREEHVVRDDRVDEPAAARQVGFGVQGILVREDVSAQRRLTWASSLVPGAEGLIRMQLTDGLDESSVFVAGVALRARARTPALPVPVPRGERSPEGRRDPTEVTGRDRQRVGAGRQLEDLVCSGPRTRTTVWPSGEMATDARGFSGLPIAPSPSITRCRKSRSSASASGSMVNEVACGLSRRSYRRGGFVPWTCPCGATVRACGCSPKRMARSGHSGSSGDQRCILEPRSSMWSIVVEFQCLWLEAALSGRWGQEGLAPAGLISHAGLYPVWTATIRPGGAACGEDRWRLEASP